MRRADRVRCPPRRHPTGCADRVGCRPWPATRRRGLSAAGRLRCWPHGVAGRQAGVRTGRRHPPGGRRLSLHAGHRAAGEPAERWRLLEMLVILLLLLMPAGVFVLATRLPKRVLLAGLVLTLAWAMLPLVLPHDAMGSGRSHSTRWARAGARSPISACWSSSWAWRSKGCGASCARGARAAPAEPPPRPRAPAAWRDPAAGAGQSASRGRGGWTSNFTRIPIRVVQGLQGGFGCIGTASRWQYRDIPHPARRRAVLIRPPPAVPAPPAAPPSPPPASARRPSDGQPASASARITQVLHVKPNE